MKCIVNVDSVAYKYVNSVNVEMVLNINVDCVYLELLNVRMLKSRQCIF